MTMTVMARLVERGLLSWTNTIDEALPEYREVIHPGHLNTTIEMFGAHCSGITELITSAEDGQLWCYLYDTSISAYEGRRAVLLSYLRRPPDRTPGPASHQWNFANLALIALVIETITGMTCETVVKAELFDPLEMYHSGFGPPDSARNSNSPNPTQPWPHVPQTGAPPFSMRPNDRMASNPPTLWPADAVHTSLADLSKFLCFCLYGPSDQSLAHFMGNAAWEKLTQRVEGTAYSLLNLTVGTRVWARGATLSALGQSGGFAASLWIAPSIGKAFACLTNVSGEVGTTVVDEAATLCTRFG
jgi:CubicO group peptidase (beta-lactamase class C family)